MRTSFQANHFCFAYFSQVVLLIEIDLQTGSTRNIQASVQEAHQSHQALFQANKSNENRGSPEGMSALKSFIWEKGFPYQSFPKFFFKFSFVWFVTNVKTYLFKM